jgi:hypothetical protein
MDNVEKFIKYLENLKDKDWKVMVTSKWTVKDVVSHLVGWEEECAKALINFQKTKKSPWFLDNENHDYSNDFAEFNAQSVEKYKSYSPKELLEKWKYFIRMWEKEIKKVDDKTKSKLKPIYDSDSHYIEHWKQIKKVLKK